MTIIFLLIVISMLIQPSFADVLQGSVQHNHTSTSNSSLNDGLDKNNTSPLSGGATSSVKSSSLKAVSTDQNWQSKLKKGTIYSDALLPPLYSEEGWYWIPAWRAGTFHREVCIEEDGMPYTNRVDHLYGFQKDRNGDIWHYESWPRREIVETEEGLQLKIITSFKPLKITANEYSVRWDQLNYDLDRQSKRIKRNSRQWDVQMYVPYGTNAAIATDVGTVNDIHCPNNSMAEQRIKPFSRLDSLYGKDLRVSFKKYLISHGMSDLVPDDLR